MIALFSRQAERFADAVDNGRAGDPDFAPLLRAVDRLRATPAPTPSEEFRADLRTRLMLEAEASLTPRTSPVPRSRKRSRRRTLVAAAAALAVVGGTAGVAAAAQGANPGDVLYPVKRAIERIEAAFSPGRTQQGQALLDQADTRLIELVTFTGSPDSATATINDFTDEALRGSELILGSYPSGGDQDAVTTVREFTARSMERLTTLDSITGGALSDQLAAAAQALQQIDAEASALCPSCSALPAVQVPESLLPALTAPTDQVTPTGAEAHATSQDTTDPKPKKKPKRDKSGTTSGSSPGASPQAPSSPKSTSSPLDPVTSAADDVVTEATDLISSLPALPGL